MSEPKVVKCKFCDWERPLWWTANGRKYSGMDMLVEHGRDVHADEYEKMREYLGDDGPCDAPDEDGYTYIPISDGGYMRVTADAGDVYEFDEDDVEEYTPDIVDLFVV